MMKNNSALQTDVRNATQLEPFLNALEIGCTAKDEVVSSTSTPNSHAKKMEAENATKKIIGVKALVENIEVGFPSLRSKTNIEIAKEVLTASNSNWSVRKDRGTLKVEDGWVILEGELPWNYQREAAKNAVDYIACVKSVSNNIKIKSASPDVIDQKDDEYADARNWCVDDFDIDVKISGTTVTLSGTVPTWYQKEEAQRIGWNTRGIWHVQNELAVDYYSILVH